MRRGRPLNVIRTDHSFTLLLLYKKLVFYIGLFERWKKNVIKIKIIISRHFFMFSSYIKCSFNIIFEKVFGTLNPVVKKHWTRSVLTHFII